MFAAMGLDIYTFQTFPAEIKGGTVMYQIRAKSGITLSFGDAVDVLVALNDEGFGLFGTGLREDGILIYNSDVFTPTHSPGRTEYSLPVSSLARAEKEEVRHLVSGEALKRLPAPVNIIALGALLRLVNAPMAPAEKYIHDLFDRKGEAIVQMNINALHSGARFIADEIGNKKTPQVFPVEHTSNSLILTGNQMIAYGAIAAGMRFYAGYPITPATEVMEYLAKELPAYGGNVTQAEDEMAAIGMALGASYGGIKSMTASSGPGISLMVEMINLAAQAELPVVIVDVQRGGASTGMPTKTSQGDLNLALYGVHNESPRIVMAVSSVEDSFWTTIDAFNLAEEFQCPVILLSDQSLATRKSTVPPPDLSQVHTVNRLTATPEEREDGFVRFRDTETGISAMAIPGMPHGAYTSTGIEHDETGDPGYTPALAAKMKNKRFRKLETLRKRHKDEFFKLWGEMGNADIGIIAFGSTEGVIREASERAEAEGYKVAHMHLRLLNPLPVDDINEFASRCKKILVPELNYSGQLANWLRVNMDLHYHAYHKDEGIPFIPNDIYHQIILLANES
jgi:2-oxoglutarate ferredoxin oxidoreductase subunit alpha